MTAIENIRARVDEATEAAKQFSELYHETFDKRRQAISKIYQDGATLVWNGNALTGTEGISKFFESLPQSQHVIEGMDTQPLVVPEGASDQNSSVIVTFWGKVKFAESDFKCFSQSVILCVDNSKWKIVSDTFRFIE